MESIVKPIIERAQEKLDAYWKNSNRRVRVFEPKSWRNKRVILISAALTIQYVEENGSLIGSDSSEQFQDIMREITNNTLDDAQPPMAAIHEMSENAFTDLKRIKFIERCLKSPLLELSRLFAYYQENFQNSSKQFKILRKKWNLKCSKPWNRIYASSLFLSFETLMSLLSL